MKWPLQIVIPERFYQESKLGSNRFPLKKCGNDSRVVFNTNEHKFMQSGTAEHTFCLAAKYGLNIARSEEVSKIFLGEERQKKTWPESRCKVV